MGRDTHADTLWMYQHITFFHIKKSWFFEFAVLTAVLVHSMHIDKRVLYLIDVRGHWLVLAYVAQLVRAYHM